MVRDEGLRARRRGLSGPWATGALPERGASLSGGAGLPPYYAERIDAIPPATSVSARRTAAPSDPEAQAERLFRDFKLGLFTLVVVALVLVAYFWDGGRGLEGAETDAAEGVLSISIAGKRRSEMAFPARQPVAPVPGRLTGGPAPTSRTTGGASADPSRGAERGRSRSASVAATTSRNAGRRAARTFPPGRGVTYTAAPGDTLSAIALRFYGDASEWQRIFEANRSRLRRPTDLRPGMKIVIPASARSSSRRGVGGAPRSGGDLARAGPVRVE